MLCQFCGKHEATKKLQMNFMGFTRGIYICDACMNNVNRDLQNSEELDKSSMNSLLKARLNNQLNIDANSGVSIKLKLNQIYNQLELAITEERFEDAAELREQISKVETELQDHVESIQTPPEYSDVKVPLRRSSGQSKEIEEEAEKNDILNEFTKDLTMAARQGEFDPVIGREDEIHRAIQILSRRKKNNPMLLGEPGVGKTAVVEGLAQEIVSGNVPDNMRAKRLYSLDLTKMISGTKFRGEFEERLHKFIEELEKNDEVILFIDEIHIIVGAGASDSAMDAANILKPALTTGKVQVIGATTFVEFKKHFEKDAALERRFQPVTIDEPSKEDAVRIIQGLKKNYEEFHGLIIEEDAIKAAVELSERYIGDRFLPDKAIDLIDESAAKVRINAMTLPQHIKELEEELNKLDSAKESAIQNQDYKEAATIRDSRNALKEKLADSQQKWLQEQSKAVDAQCIARVVSQWTNIPVTMLTEDESERLLCLENKLHRRMVGQDEAVSAVSKAIRRNRVGIKSPHRPIGTFLFLGPTGVGKTELSKALAEEMFSDEQAMIRIDMSEYMEKHTVAKLIGSPPGYVGYDEGGQLTEKVRHKPYSIVLFDEIEKAHPDVWNILLQIMDDGILTDGQGRTVSFKNTVIIMTSNIGARNITGKSSVGFSLEDEEGVSSIEYIKDKVMDEVKKTFKPEFLNRIDDISVFHQLSKDNIVDIAGRMIDDLIRRASDAGIQIKVDKKAMKLLAEKGFDPKYGARPLKRMIQATIEDMVAEKILEGDCEGGDIMQFTVKNKEICVKISKNQNSILTKPATV